jgi:hypothetical protein
VGAQSNDWPTVVQHSAYRGAHVGAFVASSHTCEFNMVWLHRSPLVGFSFTCSICFYLPWRRLQEEVGGRQHPVGGNHFTEENTPPLRKEEKKKTKDSR